MSRAHRGILFLDEFLEFSRDCLESLREPLENKSVTIARQGAIEKLNADIQLLAAMNPCRCGSMGSRFLCHCTTTQFRQYQMKLSAPLKDRFHLRTWWTFENQDRPKEFNLKALRKKLLEIPEINKIKFGTLNLKNSGNPRQQRNQLELFISWCRWFHIIEPTANDLEKFCTFFEPKENDDETINKYRSALQ
jgi:predicted ATPase with chaperone activity